MKYFPKKEKIAVCKINDSTELYVFPLMGNLNVTAVSRLQAAIGNKTGGFIQAHTEKKRESAKVYLNPKAISTFKIEVQEVPLEIKTKIEEYNRVQKISEDTITEDELEKVKNLEEELSIYFNA